MPQITHPDLRSVRCIRQILDKTFITLFLFFVSLSTQAQIVGANYFSSDAYNADQQWMEYNSAEIQRDFGYAQRINLNALRVFGSYYAYQQNPQTYYNNIQDMLAKGQQRGIKILFVIYETVGGEDTDSDILRWSKDPLRAVAMKSPISADTKNAARWEPYRQHVRWFMNRFKNDNRLIGIEVLNEPQNYDIPFAREMVRIAANNKGSVPLSVGTLPQHTLEFVDEGVDVIQIHDNFPKGINGSIGYLENKLNQARSVNMPLWITEWQRTRPNGPNWNGATNVPADERYTDLASMAGMIKDFSQRPGVGGAFFWSLMVKPAYLAGQRKAGTINGLFWPDGAVWDLEGARIISGNPSLNLPQRKRIPYEVLRFENKEQGFWLQTTHFPDGTGYGNNVQAVPAHFTGNKTKWRLIRIDGSEYFRLENVAYDLWLQCSTLRDTTNGQPNAMDDGDTLAVRAVPKTHTGDLTQWRWVKSGDGDWRFRLQNKETGYFLQVTPLTDVDGNGFDSGLQIRAVPPSKTGSWTSFSSIDAS
ncbi:hypothetical protein TDB9533_02916 [Thalassocella blandensis]|nr:hypothetical protein TDB9533_02916 [Thalassocella blandensis]